MALLTLSRALDFLPNAPDDDETTIQNIISAVDPLVKRYLNRDIELATYDELYHGTQYRDLILNQYPIVSLSAVRTNPQPVLQVQYTDSTASVATVRVTSSGVVLTSITNGTTTTNTVSFSSTVTALATSINGVSNWSATALVGGWTASDIHEQGAFNALLSPASLMVHTEYLQDYHTEENTGILYRRAGWYRGHQVYRVQYTAGYATVPEELVQATAEIVAAVYHARGQNPNVVSENIGGDAYALQANKTFDTLSAASKYALQLHKSYRVGRKV